MIANIQVLRAVAALAVVLHHTQWPLQFEYATPMFALVGRSGVDLFFVISGFIMFHTTQDGTRTAPQFWMDRVIRIVPLYWLGTALLIVLYVAGNPTGLGAITPTNVVKSFLFLPDTNAFGQPRPILDAGWTLNYELFFYALFGMTFFLRSQIKALAALAGVFAVLWLLPKLVPAVPYTVAYYGSALIFEFLIGGAVALWYRQSLQGAPARRPLLGAGLIVAALVFVLAAGWQFAEMVNGQPELRVAVFGGPSLLMLAGALLLERSGFAARSRFLLLLGAASYAIYLFHELALQLAIGAFVTLVPGTSLAHIAGAIAAAMIASTLAGIAIYLWIERPMTDGLRAVLKRRPKTAIA